MSSLIWSSMMWMTGWVVSFGIPCCGRRASRSHPGRFHDGQLHAQADPEERDAAGAGVPDSGDHAFDTAASESAGDKDAADVSEEPFRVLFGYGFESIHLIGYRGVRADAAVLQRFHDAV